MSRPFKSNEVPEGILQQQICDALENNHSARSKNHFIPWGKLEELCTRSAVIDELGRWKWALRDFPERFVRWFLGIAGGKTVEEQAEIICNGYPETPDPNNDNHGKPLITPTTRGQVDASGDKCLRKIFAILLLIDRPVTIKNFIDEEVCDDDLPFSRGGNSKSGVSFLRRRGGEVKCLKNWSRSTVANFLKYQWAVLSPFFHSRLGPEVLHYRLQEEVILPFTECESAKMGGHGEVFRVKIHRDHHSFKETNTKVCMLKKNPSCDTALTSIILWQAQDDTESYAVKMFKCNPDDESINRELFNHEVRMLKRVRHDHVLYLFATFELQKSYYLILPWAECDLSDYWRKKRMWGGTTNHHPEQLKWMAEQCAGIAEALCEVHNHITNYKSTLVKRYPSAKKIPRATPSRKSRRTLSANLLERYQFYGVHGDIKPSNILWFPSNNGLGTLKIADFGASDFSPSDSDSLRQSGMVSSTASYRPPEDDRPKDQELPESINSLANPDIWALGCVYLEFITWYVGGEELLDRLENRKSCQGNSAYFRRLGTKPFAEIKPQVKEVPTSSLPPRMSSFVLTFLSLAL